MHTPNPTPEHDRRARGEHGATLVLALAFLAIFGLITVSILAFSDASFRATGGYRSQRAANYGADAALDGAINRLRNDDSIGLDPAVSTGDKCNPDNDQSIFNLPSTASTPSMVVSCEVQPGSESGLPVDLGTTPPFAILSLGDRRSDGSLGVRNTEPGPYNGASTGFFNLCPGNRQESGMRFNTSVTPIDLGPILSFCFSEPNATSWNVTGDIFSNSRIVVDPSNAGPVIVTAPDSSVGTIKARGGCSGVTGCTDPGWNFGDGLGKDPGAPGAATEAEYAPRSISGLPVVDQSAAWVEARASECAAGNHIATLSPGIYTDATRLNQLFGDNRCLSATFWFQPGTYYFDFRAEAAPAASRYLCGTDQNFFGSPGSESAHQWCIAGKSSSFSGQRVVGGTPYGWAPTADPVTHILTLQPAANAGNGSGIFAFFQQSAFAPAANAKTIEDGNATADLTLGAFRPGGSIWLSGYPQVPRGSYGSGTDLEVSYAGTNVAQMNQPTVQVNYGTLFSGGTCGPYTLPKPPTNGSLSTVKLSVVNPAAATNLAACLNTGDRINSAVVQFNVSRPFFQGTPYPTAKLDGIRFLITATEQPTFPRPPSPTDPGGDCDPEKPGVQFIFGGDSHVYVPNGGMELCAGPNPADQANGKQLAVYGVPATPRLVASSVVGSTGDGVDNPNNALRIAEGSGLAPANIRYDGSSGTYEGTMTLRFPGYTPPAGYSIGSVDLRASYDSNNGCGFCGTQPAQFELVSFPGACGTPQSVPSGDNRQTVVDDVTSCMTAGNRINAQFDVRWHARWSCFFFSCPARNDELDGIEFIVTLTPNDPNANLRPQSGCIVDSPNYYYGTNSPDCALLKSDAPFFTVVSPRRGRLSIKGTVYAPSAAIDINDSDVWYPLFSRGLIARHFRLKGFKYHAGYNEPIASTYVNRTPTGRQVLLYVCKKDTGPCDPGDPTMAGRAFVTFDAITNQPTVKTWSVSQH